MRKGDSLIAVGRDPSVSPLKSLFSSVNFSVDSDFPSHLGWANSEPLHRDQWQAFWKQLQDQSAAVTIQKKVTFGPQGDILCWFLSHKYIIPCKCNLICLDDELYMWFPLRIRGDTCGLGVNATCLVVGPTWEKRGFFYSRLGEGLVFSILLPRLHDLTLYLCWCIRQCHFYFNACKTSLICLSSLLMTSLF